MNNHKNARLTVHGRLLIVRRILEDGLRPVEAAQAMGVSPLTAYKWLHRYYAEGEAGLQHRSSRPRRHPHATAKPDNQYEHEAPGDLLHLDIKKLRRFKRPGHRVTGSRLNTPKKGPGWEYVHIAIDDHSRIAFGSIHPDETAKSACEALVKAVRYYRGLVHKRTRPYSPRTNGKAERFIQKALREWAYARSYKTSEERAGHLLPWLHQYNWPRPHASLDYLPPISRSGLSVNNLLSNHN